MFVLRPGVIEQHKTLPTPPCVTKWQGVHNISSLQRWWMFTTETPVEKLRWPSAVTRLTAHCTWLPCVWSGDLQLEGWGMLCMMLKSLPKIYIAKQYYLKTTNSFMLDMVSNYKLFLFNCKSFTQVYRFPTADKLSGLLAFISAI